MKYYRKGLTLVGALSAALLLTTACNSGTDAPSEEPSNTDSFGISDDDYTLEALIAAAQEEEGTLNVYDNTGKIVEVAEEFSAKYGIKTTGTKMKSHEQIETAIREAQANNIQSDVFMIIDTPAVVGELYPENVVVGWFPPDMKDVVDPQYYDPPQIIQEATLWAYNNEIYGDQCPIDNIWDLTDAEWEGLITMYDPLIEARYPYSWNQYAMNLDDEMRAAYKEKFGEDLATDEDSATHEWVKRIAQQKSQVFNNGSKMAEAIGAPGTTNPFMGQLSTAIYRTIESDGNNLGTCVGMKPNVGFADTKSVVIAKDTAMPNSAKLFVQYMFTEEGIASQMLDGKKSTNNTLSLPADEPSGVEEFWDEVFVLDSKDAAADFDSLSEWQDFWTIHHR